MVIPYRRFGTTCRSCLHRSITQNTTALFCVVTQRVPVIPYRRFGTTCRFCLHRSITQKTTVIFWVITQRVVVIFGDVSGQPIGPIFKGQESKIFLDSWPVKMGWIEYPESSVRNYHYLLPDNPEERSCVLGYWPMKTEPTDFPETSVRNYHYSLPNNPEERSPQTNDAFWPLNILIYVVKNYKLIVAQLHDMNSCHYYRFKLRWI